jgi:hypothetical protein
MKTVIRSIVFMRHGVFIAYVSVTASVHKYTYMYYNIFRPFLAIASRSKGMNI